MSDVASIRPVRTVRLVWAQRSLPRLVLPGETLTRSSLYFGGVSSLSGRWRNKADRGSNRASAHGTMSADEVFDLELLRQAVGYQRWVLSALGPRVRGRVLEVGAGLGNFTR